MTNFMHKFQQFNKSRQTSYKMMDVGEFESALMNQQTQK